ncbi:MAG TPA: transglycosylase domain-containing protein [Sphingomonas sp.]|nr:transglycosylase domain-containing protein [Sphingomonas sp.]
MVGTFRPETMHDDLYPAYSRRPGDRLARDDRLGTADAADPDFWPLGDDGYPIDEAPARPRRIRWGRWIVRGMGAGIVLLVLVIAWLAVTAPLSKSLEPPTPPSITLLAEDGTPIARRGAIIGDAVDASTLPDHVSQAFLAIEDRRFYSHWGIDPRGIARAAIHNFMAGGVVEGGSTITQQLAKNAFLDSDRNAGRKLREALISFWLEAWLTKNEILSRYLSNVYFGDNVYGLDAAAHHYFSRDPKDLTIAQAAMLAGLVKAPSRLAPTGNLKGARARQKLVVGAMEDAGFITHAEALAAKPAVLHVEKVRELPNGTYFADWVLPAARDSAGEVRDEMTVRTTLDMRLQKAAERAVRRAGLRQAQVALVAMKPDGSVVAMVGGKSYADSPFNRATQARRQPGSTFKLFVYLAALRYGMTPDSMVADEPITIAGWSPRNDNGKYRGDIPLSTAFAISSNVAAARLTQEVGVRNVIRAARDLGISTPIPNEATIALGTANVSVLELTSAFAAIAAGAYPVEARGIAETRQKGWLESLTGGQHDLPEKTRRQMLELLQASVNHGTSRNAQLAIDTFGKTGTTQDNRDAWFVGFADGLVTGVWVGNDDNSPNPGLHGGGVPAGIWRNFMSDALGVSRPAPPPEPVLADETDDPVGNLIDATIDLAAPSAQIQGQIGDVGINLSIGDDGRLELAPVEPPAPPARDRARRPEEAVTPEDRP